MMQWKQMLLGCSAVSCLGLSATTVRAESACDGARSVELTIQLEPPESSAREQLQQRVAAELQARQLQLCTPLAGERHLAHVHLSVPLPELSPTRVKIGTDGGAEAERTLDVAALPREARASAIASATDELLSSLLQSAPSAAASSELALAAEPDRQPSTAPEQEAAWTPGRWELGLGGGGALFEAPEGLEDEDGGAAYQGEFLGRWRPLPRLSATLRAGLDRGLLRQTAWYDLSGYRIKERSSGWHVGLDLGFELLDPAGSFGLAPQLGLALARVKLTEERQVPTPVGPGVQYLPTDSSWELATNVGAELSFRSGRWGAALGLALLVPLTPREERLEGGSLVLGAGDPQWDVSQSTFVLPGPGFGEQLGGQLNLRLWVALGS